MTSEGARIALEVADWRRRVAAIYAEVRSADDAAIAHERWRVARDRLLAEHPATPLLPEARAGFTGVPVVPYDPAWRFELALATAEPARLDVATGTDGTVPFERVGAVEVPGVGSLDVWRLLVVRRRAVHPRARRARRGRGRHLRRRALPHRHGEGRRSRG